MKLALLGLSAILASATEHFNEVKIMDGHQKRSVVRSPLPHT